MTLKDYFKDAKGNGILATADDHGKVDAAVYAMPHCQEDGTVAFIMADRLSHANIQKNPYAVYLFMEDGAGYNGKRLYLTKIKESDDQDLIESIRHRKVHWPYDEKKAPLKSFLVYFKVDSTLPLIGDGE